MSADADPAICECDACTELYVGAARAYCEAEAKRGMPPVLISEPETLAKHRSFRDAVMVAYLAGRDKAVADLACVLEGVYVGDPSKSLYTAGKKDGYLEAAGTVRHHYDPDRDSE